MATNDLIATDNPLATDDFIATDAFVATEPFLATENGTFTLSERLIPTDPFTASRALDRSGFPTTRRVETSGDDSAGGAKVTGGSWLMIVAIVAAVVALMIAVVAAWRITKCVRGQGDSEMPQESSEVAMQSEAGTGFGSFTQDVSAIYFENPNELEGADMIDSEGIGTDLIESDGVLLDDPDELL